MESGKPVERDKIIFPILYNRRNVDIGKIIKEEYLNLQTVMKKPFITRPVIIRELGECIPCFPANRGLFCATGSNLGNGMRKFVKAKKDFNIP